MKRSPVIVAYDISGDRARRAALRILSEWRLDGQRSVHECLLDRQEAATLFARLTELLDPETDRLLLTRVHPRRCALARGLGHTDGIGKRLWDIR